MMPGIKSNNVVFEERVIIVMDMLLSGLKRREILENIRVNEKLKWKVERAQIDNYIAVANKLISESTKEEKESLIAKAFSKYEFIYKKLIAVKDYKGAVAAIEKSCSLMGLNAPEKHTADIVTSIRIIRE